MLKVLHVENFKAWRELSMEFGKVTALFGENSAGKSNLMQFLLMLKQTKNAADRVSAEADVLNATDSDWAERRALTDSLGVVVRQLCLRYAAKTCSGA